VPGPLALPTRRLLLALTATAALCAAGAASASAATYTWIGGSGSYTEPSNWSASPSAPGTLPVSADTVLITAAGDYTVTYQGPPGVQRTVASLTLGNPSSGTQRLLIKTANGSGDGRLQVDGATTFTSHAQVILDQDATGLSTPANQPQLTLNGPATNGGLILARREGTVDNRVESLGTGTITNTGTIHVASGQFNVRHIANTGNITVDAGAELYLSTGSQAIGVAQNGGTVVNDGTITLANSGWAQNGGAVTGNAVRILTGALAAAGGTGAFLVEGNGNKLSGTVGAGQTVQLGSHAEEMSNYMNIQPGGLTVAAGGTVVLDPPPANGAELLDNPITVDGTLRVTAAGTRANITGGLTVGATGTLDLQSGVLELRGSPVNHGMVSVAPGATVRLAGDGFASDGTLSFQLASPASFGTITRISAAKVGLGGTATGVPVGGYAPAAGTAFKVVDAAFTGAFGAIGGGFTAQYAPDGTSVSLLFGAAAVPSHLPGDGSIPVVTPKPTPKPATVRSRSPT